MNTHQRFLVGLWMIGISIVAAVILYASIATLNKTREIYTQIHTMEYDRIRALAPSRTPYPQPDPNDPICGDPAQLHKPAR